MTHSNSVKHVLLAVGLGALVAACGGTEPPAGPTFQTDIQKDLAAQCAGAGCHNKTATNKLKVDTAAGQEMANYQLLFDQQLVIKNDAANSPLIKVVTTGKGPSGASHQTLSATKLATWTSWVNAGAPF